jgi:hypothetical protein
MYRLFSEASMDEGYASLLAQKQLLIHEVVVDRNIARLDALLRICERFSGETHRQSRDRFARMCPEHGEDDWSCGGCGGEWNAQMEYIGHIADFNYSLNWLPLPHLNCYYGNIPCGMCGKQKNDHASLWCYDCAPAMRHTCDYCGAVRDTKDLTRNKPNLWPQWRCNPPCYEPRVNASVLRDSDFF